MIKKVYDKLNALPVWVSYVAAVLACMVAAVPSIIQFDSVMEATIEMYGLADSTVGNYLMSLSPAVKYVSAILGAFISFGIMELISMMVYNLFIRAISRGNGRGYYAVGVRYTYAVYKLATGLFSLTAVYAPAAYNYGYEIFNFVVLTVLFTICYLGVRRDSVNELFVFTVYSKLYNVFFIFEGVISLFNFMMIILDNSGTYAVGDKVVAGVLLAVVAGSAAALYFTVHKKLKKEQSDAKANYVPPAPPSSGSDGGEIFRGYGV